jgi:hypothetical protein
MRASQFIVMAAPRARAAATAVTWHGRSKQNSISNQRLAKRCDRLALTCNLPSDSAISSSEAERESRAPYRQP